MIDAPKQADVVVIGGSLAGLTTALMLAREGVQVVLLEAGRFDDAHGLGSVEDSVVEHPHRTLHALGDRMEGLLAFTERNRHVLMGLGGFDPSGVLWVSSPGERRALEESACAMDELGRPAKLEARGLWLEAQGMLREGARTQLIKAARAAGAELFEEHQARLGAEETAVFVGNDRIDTELVVLAAGWGNAALDARLAMALSPIREVGLSAVGPTDPWFSRAGQGWISWRAEGERVTLSGARWATPHLEVGEQTPTPDGRVVAKLQDILRSKLGQRGATTARCWIVTQSLDQLPLIGPLPGQSRRIVATGFGTNPATWSFAAAEAVTQGILYGTRTVPPLLSSSRLTRWRLR